MFRRLRHLSRADLPVGLGLGLAFAWLAAFWFSPFHLTGPVTAADFPDYCAGVHALLMDNLERWPPKRAVLAGLLPSLLQPTHGTIDALAYGAFWSTAALGAGLYWWGRALGGCSSGLWTLGMALSMAPLVALPRMLSFYPEITATLVLGGALLAAAVRDRRAGTALLAGCAVGACFLVDVRGLIWGLAYLGLGALALPLAGGRTAAAILRLAAFLLPVLLSWPLGWWSFPEGTLSLEEQVDVRPLFALHGATGHQFHGPYTYPSTFRWGHVSPLQLLSTFQFLREQSAIQMPAGLSLPGQPGDRERHVLVWIPWLVGAMSLAALCLRRRPLYLLVALGTAVPFLLVFRGLTTMVEVQVRFLTQALPGLALLMGLSGALAWRGLGRLAGAPRRVWALAGVGLMAALVSGLIPNWFSPNASWRRDWAPEIGDLERVTNTAGARKTRRPMVSGVNWDCMVLLRKEWDQGWPRESQLYGHHVTGSR